MGYTNYVDVFHGCGRINLPEPEGVVASWHPIKAITGNTNPAACLPFGKYSVCPYSSGYSSGYGVNCVNSDSRLPVLMDKLRLKGFSHFHNSGTGAIRVYYNYAVTTPYYGEKQPFYDISGETGRPGYYGVTLAETAIRCELTVSPFAAYHRYHFDRPGGKIAIDFSNDGLYDAPGLRGEATQLEVTASSSNVLQAAVTLQGIRLYFVATFEGKGQLDGDGVFCLTEADTVTVRVSVSAQIMEDALEDSRQATESFDQAAAAAEQAWEEALGKIQVESDDEQELSLFYSNLYHTLVKPNDWNGGGFLWKGAPFVVDFSTMWDIYKTQLPLVYTLFPETSAHIVDFMKHLGDAVGHLPNTFMLSSRLDIESNQARMLIEYTLYDAWKRGVSADWQEILRVIKKDMDSEDFRRFEETGHALRATHTLDMAEISNGLAEMAKALGDEAMARRLEKLTGNWRNAFDDTTGLMVENSQYYEGNHWNYSFRPMVHSQERITLCGSEENYVNLLDRFFGYTDSQDVSARFEGFNNETDLEAPYAYHYAGRRDRLCEILDLADRCVFREKSGGTGRGGIPGNNDSGGLSSCYIWNCLGAFPVSGQNVMLLSRPKFRKVRLLLANGKELVIENRSSRSCPGKVEFNGAGLEDFKLPVTAFMSGGTLCFYD